MYVQDTIPESPPRQAFGFYLLMTVVITACLMAICYLAMLEAWYGEVRLSASAAQPAAWTNGQHVLLAQSTCAESGASEEAAVWQRFLRRAAIPFDVVVLPPAGQADSGVLVLPSAECVNEAWQSAISEWLQKGGGVVATGALATKDARGRTREAGLFRKIVGGEPHAVPDGSDYLVLVGQPPLALGVLPGERWRVRVAPRSAVRSEAAQAYWLESTLEPTPGTNLEEVAAVVHRSVGRGRVVWFGARLDAVLPDEKNHEAWERLFLNAVRWAGRRPLAAVATWPGGQQTAVAVAQEIHNAADIPDALAMARLFRERRIPATFFVPAPLPQVSTQLRELAREAEIGVLGGYPRGSPPVENPLAQRQWLEQVGGVATQGYRIPEGWTEQVAQRQMVRGGYSYYIISPSRYSAAPAASYFPESKLFPLDARVVVGLPLIARNDLDILTTYKGHAYSQEGLVEELWRDFEKVSRLGGVYLLNHRTDLLGSPPARAAILGILERLQKEGTWLASASDVTNWWMKRQQLEVEAVKLSQRRIRVVVSNIGNANVSDILVYLALPYVPKGLRVSSAVFGGKVQAYEVHREQELVRLKIARVSAQSSLILLVDLID